MSNELNKIFNGNAALTHSLQCYLLPTQTARCTTRYRPFCQAAYSLWHDVLEHALQNESQIKEAHKLSSDIYCLQREAGCLFYGKQPVGLFLYNWFDLDDPADLDSSYWDNYPTDTLQTMHDNQHSLIMTVSNLTVHPDWRKSKVGPGVSDLLTGFASLRLLESRAAASLTYSRNNRKTNELGYRWGAEPLVQGHSSHGIESDVLVFYRDNIQSPDIPGIKDLTERLWREKHVGLSPKLYKRHKVTTLGKK